ncbi:odorant receptor 43a-like [Pseudomyrmex gracilis]|uniref:odorant receptor 43a-like n=1 Tax=Pseudomyrmex gracilis TaxID=219809 RepID=UPI000995AD4A|nr:odorant receptor 43a-like [Pseudomyrmex gracilis]
MLDRNRSRSVLLNTLVDDTTKHNESHASDFYYAVQISVCLLKPIGAWPLTDDETSRFKIARHKMSMLIATFLMLFSIVPWMLNTFVTEKMSVYLIIRVSCSLLFLLMVFAKYVLLLWHQDQLKICISHVADDWRSVLLAEDREVMLKNARMGRTFGIVSMTFMFSCDILYHTLPLVTPKMINEDNVTIRVHPSPCELLVLDSKSSPVYEIVYLLQLLGGYTTDSVFCGICSLMANLVTHVSGQCNVLTSVFEEIVDGGKRNAGSIEDRITTAVTRHLRLLKLVSVVSNLFIEICLVEFVNASCNICLLGYYVIIDVYNNESFVQIFMYAFGLVSVIFNVFIFCYIGDLLKERCQEVGTACYSIEWYRMPPKIAIKLMMPILMSRYPVALTAGKLMTMSIPTFSFVSNVV